jgi:hypothetical protein
MDARLDARTGTRTRELGPQEQYLHELHGYGGLIPVSCQAITGPLTPDLVQRGLDWLQKKHPLLAAHIRYKGLRFRKELPFVTRRAFFELEGTTPIPLSVLPAGTDWRAFMQKECRTPIRRGRNPRMRATLILPGPDGISRLITATDHTISDAPAGMMASRQLLEFFADPEREVPAAASGLPPALETFLPPKSGTGDRPYLPAIRLPVKANWRARRETHSVSVTFSKEETALINELTKKNRATIHGTMNAALLEAIGALYQLDEVTAASTIELRRMCKPPLPPDTYGCYIDILRLKHTIGGPFWDMARDASYKLVATVAREMADASILKPISWRAWREESRRGLMKSGMRLDAMGMTSAGRVDIRREFGPFRVVDTTMLMSMHLLGPGFFAVNFESEDQLRLMLNYASHAVPDADMQKLLDHAANRLRTLPLA